MHKTCFVLFFPVQSATWTATNNVRLVSERAAAVCLLQSDPQNTFFGSGLLHPLREPCVACVEEGGNTARNTVTRSASSTGTRPNHENYAFKILKRHEIKTPRERERRTNCWRPWWFHFRLKGGGGCEWGGGARGFREQLLHLQQVSISCNCCCKGVMNDEETNESSSHDDPVWLALCPFTRRRREEKILCSFWIWAKNLVCVCVCVADMKKRYRFRALLRFRFRHRTHTRIGRAYVCSRRVTIFASASGLCWRLGAAVASRTTHDNTAQLHTLFDKWTVLLAQSVRFMLKIN